MSVVRRLHKIKQEIDFACARAHRDPNSVRLLAVSKLQPPELIREAFQAAQIDFAENYVQEALAKRAPLADCPELRWHFIGRIQSNKAKVLASGQFAAIHSVDRMEVATALDRAARALGQVQDIFLQVNIAAEPSKAGVRAAEFEQFLTQTAKCANLRILGLMVMPPLFEDPEKTRPFFAQAAKMLRETRGLLADRHPYRELSMGTSHDFKVAIEEGATWLRIGTDIFGARKERE